jgi:hypothetical protein
LDSIKFAAAAHKSNMMRSVVLLSLAAVAAQVCSNAGPKLTRVGGLMANQKTGLESAAYEAETKTWFATANEGKP